MAAYGMDKIRGILWDELRGLKSLLEPAGSRATAKGNDKLEGNPNRTPQRATQRLPVGSATDGRLIVGTAPTLQARTMSGGMVPVIRGRRGLSQLWIDIAEDMPISAVPPVIRRSLYNTLTHRVGMYPMNDKWYPIAMKANTANDLRWNVPKPPTAIAGNTPRGVSMSPRSQFRRAWRVPRYSTLPDVAVPTSRNIAPGGVAP